MIGTAYYAAVLNFI